MEKNQFAEQVFDTACGFLVKEACVPGIENLFAPGKPCDLLYQEMTGVRERLAKKTGLEEDDPDIERMIDLLMKIARMTGVEMFLYGMQYKDKKTRL